MDDLASIIARVPESTHFPSVAEILKRLGELHARAGASATLRLIGRSRQWRPLLMLSVGEGDRHAVVTGMPHPNEPVGALGALALAELLISDEALRKELGLVWHIIPCADPDGAVLNEGWMQGPFTRRNYAEYVYRSPFTEQYEWTFSRPELDMEGIGWIPESRAVAEVIDELKPALLVSMHNAEAGGVFAYVTDNRGAVRDVVESVGVATGLEVAAVQPEGTDELQLGRGLWLMEPEIEGMVGSTGYAQQYQTLGAIVEAPMWRDPRSGDERASSRSRQDVKRECDELRAETHARMDAWMKVLRSHASLDSPFGRALESLFSSMAGIPGELADAVEGSENCSIAEEASLLELVRMERLRGVGHVLGVLREMRTSGVLSGELLSLRGSALSALDEWTPEEEEQEFVGLGPAVRSHVGIALELARNA